MTARLSPLYRFSIMDPTSHWHIRFSRDVTHVLRHREVGPHNISLSIVLANVRTHTVYWLRSRSEYIS